MLQIKLNVGTAQNGSMTAVVASGMTNMSDALIGCQPRIDDPSKPNPSSKIASSYSLIGIVKCCQVPSRSINLRSTASACCSRAKRTASLGVIAYTPPSLKYENLYCVVTPFTCTNAYHLFHWSDKNFAVTDPTGPSSFFNRLYDFGDHLLLDDDFKFDLGEKVD